MAPLALAGFRRRRAWLLGLAVTLVLCLPFWTLWVDYVHVVLNTRSSRGVEYALGELPTALLVMAAAWSGRGPRSVDRVAAESQARAEGG